MLLTLSCSKLLTVTSTLIVIFSFILPDGSLSPLFGMFLFYLYILPLSSSLLSSYCFIFLIICSFPSMFQFLLFPCFIIFTNLIIFFKFHYFRNQIFQCCFLAFLLVLFLNLHLYFYVPLFFEHSFLIYTLH